MGLSAWIKQAQSYRFGAFGVLFLNGENQIMSKQTHFYLQILMNSLMEVIMQILCDTV